VFDFPTF
jgi:predicted alpha/beta-fold hydrolase